MKVDACKPLLERFWFAACYVAASANRREMGMSEAHSLWYLGASTVSRADSHMHWGMLLTIPVTTGHLREEQDAD